MSLPDPASSAAWLTRRRQLESLLRLHAAVVTGDQGNLEAIRLLAEALSDREPQIRELAALALIESGPEARYALPELIVALQDESPVVRRRAIRAIGVVGPVALDDALAALVAATEDDEESVVLQAISTLGELGPSATAAVPALIAALWTGGARRRAVAGVALLRMGPATVPSLVQSLSHPSPEVRGKVAHLLGRLGRDAAEAIPALQSLLSDPDETVRAESQEALAAILSSADSPER